MTTFGAVSTPSVLQRSIILTLDDFRKGVSAPTDTTVGTTPTIAVFLFDNIAELLSTSVAMPVDWDKNHDISVELVWSLVNSQTNGDVLSVTIDYPTILKETTGGGVAGTSTQLTPELTVTTGNGLAVNDVYTMTVTADNEDAANGYSAGDNTMGIGFEFHLTNTTGVAAVHLLSACINYQAKY